MGKVIDDIDSEVYEDVFLKWDANLRNTQYYNVQVKCEQILEKLSEQTDQTFEDIESVLEILEKTPFTNPLSKHEVIIESIFTRVYNKNPGLFISCNFDHFIGSLSVEFFYKTRFLDYIHRLFKDQEISMDDLNDETWVKWDGQEEGLTKHRVKKIYRYISQQCLYTLTSLMLSVEQLTANEFNPVLLLDEKKTRRLSMNVEETKSLEVKEPLI